MIEAKYPLVSVLVVTYNSADYIIKTLDSVKNQTYTNLELIISDDHSSDNTLSICNSWISNNKDRFSRIQLIDVPKNTGVSANYNRGVQECQGEWIKNVDGDDLLLPDCIAQSIQFTIEQPEAQVIFSNAQILKGDSEYSGFEKKYFNESIQTFFNKNASEQYVQLLNGNILPSQTAFILTKLLKRFPYNELYRGLEDYPMWITLLKNGYQFYYFDDCTAIYRIGESITKSKKRFYSPIYAESSVLFSWSELFPEMKRLGLQDAYNTRRKFLLKFELYEALLRNEVNPLTYVLSKVLNFIVNKISVFKY